MEHSPTLRMAAPAGRMKADAIDVLDFSVGRPDSPTPEVAKDLPFGGNIFILQARPLR